MVQLTFAAVYYAGKDQEHARVTVQKPGKHFSMVWEQTTWEKLFDLLGKLYPGLNYEIPDEIDVIEYDKHYREIK